MTEQSITSFLEDILDSNCLLCALCKEILKPPVMLIENIGNVCSICFEENDDISKHHSLHNIALETILKLLKLPCKYNQKGCSEKLTIEELINHQHGCKYRTKLCSMFKFGKCDWEGNTNDFIQHFKDSHGDHVINFENNIFFLETSLTELDLVKLLVMKNRIYILRMQTNKNRNKLFYMICNVKDEHNSFCEYSVKHKGASENYIKTKSKILSSYNIYNDFDENIAVQVDLNALKQISHISDTITNVFKIKFEDTRMEGIDDNMLQFFECPVCKSFMKPPIYQCQSGHSICNLCRPRVEKCPTCRAIFGTTRNYSLEGLTNGVLYPCLYHDLGCTETSSSAAITRHERECSFKPYNCPFTDCNTNGNHQMIVSHLINLHADAVISTGVTEYTESFRLDFLSSGYNKIISRKCIVAFNHIFRLTCKRIAEHCLWAAEVFGCKSDSKTFVYEVAIVDMRRPEKKLIRTDYCLCDLGEEEMFKRCIMFPTSILSSYSHHGMLTFHFNVKQK